MIVIFAGSRIPRHISFCQLDRLASVSSAWCRCSGNLYAGIRCTVEDHNTLCHRADRIRRTAMHGVAPHRCQPQAFHWWRYTGTRRVYSNDEGGKCFFIDLCIHRQCGFAVCFPKPWRRQTPTHQKRLPCGAGAGRVLCRSCFSRH